MANPFSKAMQWTGRQGARAVKAFQMRWQGMATGLWSRSLLPRTQFNYAREIGDGRRSNIIMACVGWMARNFPEAPVQVVDDNAEGLEEVVPRHAMTLKLRRPNPHYSGVLLWMATIPDLLLNGNAYWAIVPARGGDVAEFWWIPSWMVEPKWPDSGLGYISHYDYRPDGINPIRVEPKELVHFRYGLDPNNTRLGAGTLPSLVREVFTDEEAANFTAAILRNLGVPGVFIAPDGPDSEVSPEDADATREKYAATFGGDERGGAFIMSGPTKVTRLSFSPQELDLKALRRIPEERVSAVIGIPAIVAGLGAGLDRSTFANMAEAREMAWEGGIVPLQRLLAADLDIQLLPHFSESQTEQTRFDVSKVRALQEDENKKATRWAEMVRGGYAQVAEARAAQGLEVQEADKVYLRSVTILEVPAGQPQPLLTAGNTEPEKTIAALEFKARPLQAGRQRRINNAMQKLAAFLDAQGKRVAQRLAGFGEAARGNGGTEAKQTPDDLLPHSELAELERLLGGLHVSSIEYAAEAAGGMIGAPGITEADPAFRGLLQRVSERITGIHAETKQAISTQLAVGRERGYSIRQIVNGVPADGYVGMADSHGFGRARAELVARTEVATVENWTASATWKQSGFVTEADILDGDGCGWTSHADPDTAHGSRRSLSEVDDYPVAHPNCVRVPVPVVTAQVPA